MKKIRLIVISLVGSDTVLGPSPTLCIGMSGLLHYGSQVVGMGMEMGVQRTRVPLFSARSAPPELRTHFQNARN